MWPTRPLPYASFFYEKEEVQLFVRKGQFPASQGRMKKETNRQSAEQAPLCLMAWLHDPVSCIQYACKLRLCAWLLETFPVNSRETMHGLSLPHGTITLAKYCTKMIPV